MNRYHVRALDLTAFPSRPWIPRLSMRASRCRAGRSRRASRSDRPPRRPARGPRSSVAPVAVTFSTRPPSANSRPRSIARAGVEDGHAFDLGGGFEAADPAALGIGAGIAPGRHDHGQRGIGRTSAARMCPSMPVGAPSRSWPRSLSSRGRSTWHSGSPKRTLNSSSFGPVLGHHQPGVEHAAIGRALRAHAGDGRARRSRRIDPLDQRVVDHGRRANRRPCRPCSGRCRRRRRACGPGRAERQHRLAVGQREQAGLLAARGTPRRRPCRPPRRSARGHRLSSASSASSTGRRRP